MEKNWGDTPSATLTLKLNEISWMEAKRIILVRHLLYKIKGLAAQWIFLN